MIFTVYMLLCTVLGVVFASKIANNKRSRIAYCTFGGMGLFLIAALRDTDVGYDSIRYAHMFKYMGNIDYSDIWANFDEEPLFYAVFKVLAAISDNPNFMFACIGAVFAIAISFFIYKFSEIPYISYIMLIPMQFFPFTLSGCRQAVALSIVILAFNLIINRHYLKAFLTFFIAYFFHNSVIIALPLLLLCFLRSKIAARLLFAIGFFFTFVFRDSLLRFITAYIYTDYDVFDEEAGSLTTLIMYFGIYAMSVILINNIAFQRKTDSLVLKDNYSMFKVKDPALAEKSVYVFLETMLAFGIIIQIFVPLQPNIFRAAMYYQLASVIIVPKAITNIPNRLFRAVAIMVFFVIMALLYFRFTYYAAGANPYAFFWQ